MGSRRKRILILAVSALLLVSLPLAVYAYLYAGSGQLGNAFTPAPETDPAISETFDDNEKKDVSVSVGKTGYSVYVRAAIVVTWKDKDGNVYAEKPVEGVDYTIVLNDDGSWFEYGGYYYHKAAVESEGNTEVLIEECAQLTTAPSDYALSVQVIAQTIQAAGTTDTDDTPAVTDAWGVAVKDDKLTVP